MDEVRSESVRRAPAPALRGLVAAHGYDLRGHPAGTHRGLPAPSLTLVVGVGEPLVLEDAAGRRTSHRAVLAGLHRTPARIVHHGHQCGVHLVLPPAAARVLFGYPPAALAEASVDADDTDALGAAGRELAERVDGAGGWDARFSAVDDVLTRLLTAGPPRSEPPPELGQAWTMLARGATRVRDVARTVGWSERHLERRFRAEYGVTPKTVARIGRFHRVRHRLAARAAAGRALDLAGLAAGHGFADQAHLAAEFRALAGCAPTRWLAEEGGLAGTGLAEEGPEREVGNVQDAPAAGAGAYGP